MRRDPYPHPSGGDMTITSLNMQLFALGRRPVAVAQNIADLQATVTQPGSPEQEYKDRLIAWLKQRAGI